MWKIHLFFSKNTTQYNRELILNRLRMKTADANSLYLGLPNTITRNKSVVFAFLKERVRRKVQSWDGKTSSKGVRRFY